MGANAVRSIIGPHDGHLYDLCDKEGVLAWVDVPFSRYEHAFSDVCYYPTMAFHDNGIEQLKEVVAQNYNHPSIVMWGIFSLVWQRGDDLLGYVGELNELAHALDVSRPTVSCSNSDGAINFVTDLVVLRQNVGWMKGSIEDVDIWCEQLSSNKTWSSLHCGVAYGEAGVRGHNAERVERASRDTRHLPERRQTNMHERYIEQIDEAGIFWGVWLDNMFDYASARRPYGMNLAGMVEYNHADKKDAYYLYRARWNGAAPTLHIADKVWRDRRDTLQSVDVYSSVGEPVMLIDGDTIPVRRVGEAHYRADSVVVHGTKTIRATDASGRYNDSATIKVVR
jgi:beta-galactosidase